MRRRINLALEISFYPQEEAKMFRFYQNKKLSTNNKVGVEGRMSKKRANWGHRQHALPAAHAHSPQNSSRPSYPPAKHRRVEPS